MFCSLEIVQHLVADKMLTFHKKNRNLPKYLTETPMEQFGAEKKSQMLIRIDWHLSCQCFQLLSCSKQCILFHLCKFFVIFLRSCCTFDSYLYIHIRRFKL